jgi:hypothetical protein
MNTHFPLQKHPKNKKDSDRCGTQYKKLVQEAKQEISDTKDVDTEGTDATKDLISDTEATDAAMIGDVRKEEDVPGTETTEQLIGDTEATDAAMEGKMRR